MLYNIQNKQELMTFKSNTSTTRSNLYEICVFRITNCDQSMYFFN